MNPLWRIAAIAVGILLVLALVGGGVQTWRLHTLQASIASERAAWAQQEAARERIARQAIEGVRAKEAAHAAKQQEITDAFQEDARRQAAALASSRADADSLRDLVASFAAGGGQGAGADATACLDWKRRAAALGRALTRTDQAAGRYAERADRYADYARLLKEQVFADRAACSPAAPEEGRE